jgi:hypothetical protein
VRRSPPPILQRGDGTQIVEVDRVHRPGVGHDDRRSPAERFQGGGERVHVHRLPAAGQERDRAQAVPAHAEDRERLGDAGVRAAVQDVDGPEGRRALAGRVHAQPLAEPLTGHGQPHRIGDGRASHERAPVLPAQPEQLPQPAQDLALQGCREGVATSGHVLVVDAGQPVPGDGDRGGAPGDETEVAGSGGAGESRRPALREAGEGAPAPMPADGSGTGPGRPPGRATGRSAMPATSPAAKSRADCRRSGSRERSSASTGSRTRSVGRDGGPVVGHFEETGLVDDGALRCFHR